MKNNWFNKVWPHILAIVIFLIVSVMYNRPALEGNVMKQHDIVGWKGAAQNAFDVKEKTGHFPLWNTNIFSGMPNYQIAAESEGILPDFFKIAGLGLPKPINYFFISCLCFYLLCMAFGLSPVTGILGGLAYAFSTYNPIIIGVGHESKMLAIAVIPLLMAGLILIYKKRYWLGLVAATLGACMELMANHPQTSYYFFIVIAAVTLAYVYVWVKKNQFKHLVLSMIFASVAGLAGLGCYAYTYLTTKEYAQYTMRGGKTVEIKGNEVTAVNTKGLDHDYAFQYSMRTVEPLVMLMPKAFGNSSMEVLDENSNVGKELTKMGVPENASAQLLSQLPKYWGGMAGPGEGGTSGPPYIGAIIVLLAIIGFVIVRGPLKWALLAATIFSIFMAWGKFFSGFNNILFDLLPLYNKFRAPSMALMISQLTLPLMAVLTVNQLFFVEKAKENLQHNFKKILYTLGGVVVVLAFLYLAQNYSSALDEQIMSAKFDQSGSDAINRAIVTGLKADRQSMFGGQIIRAILFMAILLGILFGFMRNMLKPVMAVGLLAIVCFIDLWVIDKNYLNADNFMPKDELQNEAFAKTPMDEKILADKDPHFRVFDVSRGMNDNRASYYHRSVLGYHAAKLRIYQDVIERYIGGAESDQILNALDVKYIINQNQQGQVDVMQNPAAYGAAWFVKFVKPMPNEVEELQAISKTNLKDTAIVPQAAIATIGTLQPDTAAVIALKKYTNDEIEYSTQAATPQFAVLSEVYYPAGWDAFIDGQKADIVKTNYFLRGVKVPAGNHVLKLVFDPKTAKQGSTISYISSWLVAILVLGGFFMDWWTRRKRKSYEL